MDPLPPYDLAHPHPWQEAIGRQSRLVGEALIDEAMYLCEGWRRPYPVLLYDLGETVAVHLEMEVCSALRRVLRGPRIGKEKRWEGIGFEDRKPREPWDETDSEWDTSDEEWGADQDQEEKVVWSDSEEDGEETVRKRDLVKKMQEGRMGAHLVEVRDEEFKEKGFVEKRMQGILRFAATELLENAVATRDDKLACRAMHMSVRQIMGILNGMKRWERESNWDPDARVRRIRTIAWKQAEEEGREVEGVEDLCTALVYRRAIVHRWPGTGRTV